MSDYCDRSNDPWDTSSIKYWLADRQFSALLKPWALSTMYQKVSHINFLTTLEPPCITGTAVVGSKVVQGLGTYAKLTQITLMLPPAYLLTLANHTKPSQLELCVQFQALTGLRAGQLVLITPQHLLTEGTLLAQPFKHQKLTQVLNIRVVPTWLVQKFLSFATNPALPILPWTAEQYERKFKKLAAQYHAPQGSHAARHFFASLHKYLGDPLQLIARSMIHKEVESVETYLHSFTHAEQLLIMQHPDYFMPLLKYMA